MNHPVEPKTLLAAKEQIASLTSELKTLRAGSTGAPIGAASIAPLNRSSPPKPKLADSNSEPTYSTDGTLSSPGSTRLSPTPMPVNYPMPAKKALPPEADTPVLIQKILDVTNIDDLRSMLDNNVHTPLQRTCIYNELKSRRALLGE